MYNRLFFLKKGEIFLDIPIISFDLYNNYPLNYSDILEIIIDYKVFSPLPPIYLDKELILYSLDNIDCIYLHEFFVKNYVIYNEKLIFKISFKKIRHTDLSLFPKLKNVYRDIQINKIINDV